MPPIHGAFGTAAAVFCCLPECIGVQADTPGRFRPDRCRGCGFDELLQRLPHGAPLTAGLQRAEGDVSSEWIRSGWPASFPHELNTVIIILYLTHGIGQSSGGWRRWSARFCVIKDRAEAMRRIADQQHARNRCADLE